MTKVELKNKLIETIQSLEDKQVLKSLLELFNDQNSDEPIILSDEQKSAIEKARDEFTSGKTYSNNQVNEDAEEWLEE